MASTPFPPPPAGTYPVHSFYPTVYTDPATSSPIGIIVILAKGDETSERFTFYCIPADQVRVFMVPHSEPTHVLFWGHYLDLCLHSTH